MTEKRRSSRFGKFLGFSLARDTHTKRTAAEPDVGKKRSLEKTIGCFRCEGR